MMENLTSIFWIKPTFNHLLYRGLTMDIFILDSYVVILFLDKWTAWGGILGPKLHPGVEFFDHENL